MKYQGEAFINKLYKDLINDYTVRHSGNTGNKNEQLSLYFKRLEDVTNKAIEKDRFDELKALYHQKYVIKAKNVPESYFKLQERIALERGFGHVQFNDKYKQIEINNIIKDQKESLDRWIDFFASEDADLYPTWFKYYCFQSVVRIGDYDKEKKSFIKRTSETVKPFLEINHEAIAYLYDVLIKSFNKENIDDNQLNSLIMGGSFNKIYAYIIDKLDSVTKDDTKSEDGIWKKYLCNSDPKILFKDINGKGTGWCTAGSIETATAHLNGGDFYVYYTKDKDDNYTVPRIAIRMSGRKIGEIRGVASGQNIEPNMEKVVEKKINDFPDKDKYLKKVNDMKKMTDIYNKNLNNITLTKEELCFLYEIPDRILGFGHSKDPRIKEVINNRDIKNDLSIIFDCNKENISIEGEAFDDNTIVYYGDIIFKEESLDNIKFPKNVFGSINLGRALEVRNVVFPTYVKENIFLDNVFFLYKVTFPKCVNDMNLRQLRNASNVIFPKTVNGSIYAAKLKEIENVTFPEYVKEVFNVGIKFFDKLVLPKVIGERAILSGIKNATNVTFPDIVGDTLYLDSLESLDGVTLPKDIGTITLRGITRLENYTFTSRLTGSIYFDSLKTIKDVTFTENIGESFYANELSSAINLKFEKNVYGNFSMESLTYADNLVLPDVVGKDLLLDSVLYANGITFSKYVKGSLILRNLLELNNKKLPDRVDEDVILTSLQKAYNSSLPKIVGEDLLVNNLYYVNNVTFPDKVGNNMQMEGLVKPNGLLVLPPYIKGSLYFGGLKDSSNVIMSKYIGKSLYMFALESTNNFAFPEHVEGDFFLNNLTYVNNTKFPKNIGGEVNMPKLKMVDNTVIPNGILDKETLAKLVTTNKLLYKEDKYEAPNYIKPLGDIIFSNNINNPLKDNELNEDKHNEISK